MMLIFIWFCFVWIQVNTYEYFTYEIDQTSDKNSDSFNECHQGDYEKSDVGAV